MYGADDRVYWPEPISANFRPVGGFDVLLRLLPPSLLGPAMCSSCAQFHTDVDDKTKTPPPPRPASDISVITAEITDIYSRRPPPPARWRWLLRADAGADPTGLWPSHTRRYLALIKGLSTPYVAEGHSCS